MAAASLRNRSKKHKRSTKFESASSLQVKENFASVKVQWRILFLALLFFVAIFIFICNKDFVVFKKNVVDDDAEHNHIGSTSTKSSRTATGSQPKENSKKNQNIKKDVNLGKIFNVYLNQQFKKAFQKTT